MTNRSRSVAIACAAMLIAASASADDWIERPHAWVALRGGGVASAGFDVAHLESDLRGPMGGPFSRLDLWYAAHPGAEIGVGYAFTTATEIQALYFQTSLDLRADSLDSPGDMHVAEGTVRMLMGGVGWSNRLSYKRWGALGDCLVSVSVLGGVAWAGGTRPTGAAAQLGLRDITGRTGLVMGLEGRFDQRLARRLVASAGMRFCSASRMLHIEPEPGSIYPPTDARHTSGFFSLGLSYWY